MTELTPDELKRVLRTPQLALSMNYVLVIEWLSDGDERTGEKLVTMLHELAPNTPVEYFRCGTAEQMMERIAKAQSEISTRGIPVVHLEAHGETVARVGDVPSGLVGPNRDGGRDLVPWRSICDWLRPLHIASRFNLLVVAAACYGEGVLLGVEPGMPPPMTTLVGYTETIASNSLREAMKQFYRGLLLQKQEMSLAVEAANREHYNPDDAELRTTSLVVLSLEACIDGLRLQGGLDVEGKSNLDIAARVVRANGYDLSSLPYTTLTSLAPHIARQFLETAWRGMWMMDAIRENSKRFAIDYDAAVDLARTEARNDDD